MTEASPREMLAAVAAARTPADLFGSPGGPARAAKRTFRLYAACLHPDRAAAAGLGAVEATVAFERLTSLYEQWREGSATAPAPPDAAPDLVVAGQRGTYTASAAPTAGTISGVYVGADAAGEPVAIKVPRNSTSNRFLTAERTALASIAELSSKPGFEWIAPYFPRLIDTATVADGKLTREVNILGALGTAQGFVDLGTVARAFPDGLDGRDWAWIHRRLLRAIAAAHEAGVVHAAIVPENVLIHPAGHGVVLAGWSFATTEGQPLPARIASRADLYSADTAEPASPEFDVYMAHALMRTMLAPSERRQLSFARGCMQVTPRMRPSAASLLREYDDLLEDLYGRRRFRVFPYTVDAA